MGKPVRLKLSGWEAVIFQHEFDHLQGAPGHDRALGVALGADDFVHHFIHFVHHLIHFPFGHGGCAVWAGRRRGGRDTLFQAQHCSAARAPSSAATPRPVLTSCHV